MAAACSGGDPETSQADGDAVTENARETTSDEGTASEGDASYIVGVSSVPESLDNVAEGTATFVRYDYFSTLFNYKALPFEEACQTRYTVADVEGQLADSWEFSEDGTTLTVTLREGMATPDGSELTADDVVWSLERAGAIDSVAQYIGNIGGMDLAADGTVTAVDDQTVEIALQSQNAYTLAVLSLPWYNIIDMETAQEHAGEDGWASDWLGTQSTAYFGPWQIEPDNFSPGEQVIYTPNPNYPLERGNIGRLVRRAVEDAGTRSQLLQSGEIDSVGRSLSFDQVAAMASNEDLIATGCLSGTRDVLGLMLDDPVFGDVEVRKAISMAINREALVEGAYSGFATPAVSGLSSYFEHELPEDTSAYDYDPETAAQMLRDAGVEEGFQTTLSINVENPGPWVSQAATLIQADLAAVGVQAEVNTVPGASTFDELLSNGESPAYIYYEEPLLPDPSYAVGLLNGSEVRQNFHGFASDEIDGLLEELRTTPLDDPSRPEMVNRLDQLMMDTFPLVYLVDYQQTRAFSADVERYEHGPSLAESAHLATK